MRMSSCRQDAESDVILSVHERIMEFCNTNMVKEQSKAAVLTFFVIDESTSCAKRKDKHG